MAEHRTESKVKDFYEQFTESHILYDRLTYNRRYIHIHKLIREFVRPGMEVLELGCGTGITSKKILECGAKVTGIDLSENNIRFAKAVVKGGNFLAQDVLTLNLNKVFDVITLFDFMEHIPKEHHTHLFNIVRSHCHSSTVIIINIPNPRSLAYLREHQPDALQIVDEEVTIDDFAALCRQAGLYIQRYVTNDIFQKEDYDELILKVSKPRINIPVQEGVLHFIARKLWWALKGPILRKIYSYKLNKVSRA
ncbi:class I SAM-dependent methyltransferase [bacterium]|nr:class I SAM-dependent methyltransferase [bacterium]